MYYCESCLEKDRENEELRRENERLRRKLKYENKKSKEGYFGSSTPSSQKPFKENSKAEEISKNGGAKKGHKGNSRKSVKEEEADEIINLLAEEKCSTCAGELISKGIYERTIIESVPVKVKKILYKCEKKYCPRCRKTVVNKPVVLPKSLYGNQLITQAALMHYKHGVPVGRIESILEGAFARKGVYDVYHRLAKLWEPAIAKIIEDYRKEEVKHADETGWRTDGSNGYAWIFCSDNTSIFQFKDTRSARVPQNIFGTDKVPGTLVVDRYAGYNKMPCKIQYCYVHLLRKVKDTGEEFIDNTEVQNFVDALTPLLSEAIRLKGTAISNKTFYIKARKIKRKIIKIVNAPASHSGIRYIQTIFQKNEDRLYHWVKDRKVPADNNRAERELRPTVIARKVSFGSQSEKGARTRSILMTIIHTAEKRLKNQTLEEWFKTALDKLSLSPDIDPYSLLPPPST